MANSVDPDETTHYEPSHQDLHCLQKMFRAERVKMLTLILPFATIVVLEGSANSEPVILTIYHMQPFRASVLIQE